MADFDRGLDVGREALCRFLTGHDDLGAMLGSITSLAVETIPGCDRASIVVIHGGQSASPASTDPTAVHRDDAQDGRVLSVPLLADAVTIGALNLHAASSSGFDEEAKAAAHRFADQLAVAAAKLVTYVQAIDLAAQLREAMESRAVIEQAKGVLMAAEGCTADGAFEILKQASQHQNRKLRTIAVEIVERRRSTGAAAD